MTPSHPDAPSNPIATTEQHETERRALELFGHPRLVETREEIRDYWTKSLPRSDEMLACLDPAFEEVMFSAVVWSLNQDPLRPKVVTITRLPHRLGELRIPGSRWGLDNPDSVYRVIPIDGDERYVIRGQAPRHRMTENYFTLWDRDMATVDVLDGRRLELGADGAFEITVDRDPANGRPNHVRSTPEAHEFYIRDVLMDWKRERINRLSIERLGGAPGRPAPSLEEELELAARYMWKWARETDRWNAQPEGIPVNHFEFKIDRDTDGALRSQIYVLGHFRLASDDEALVLTVDLGGADYFVAPISNAWGTTLDIQNRTASLNRAQSQPNADGTITYVLSVRDPGVHNWLDPCGLHEGTLTLRWAEFAKDRPEGGPSVTSRVVPLAGLRDHLPAETAFVTPEMRRRQCEERAASYAWRLRED